MQIERKKEHLSLAQAAQVELSQQDQRFYYEPLLGVHPPNLASLKVKFGPWKLQAPLWISSMTGATAQALKINQNLARVAGEFGLGMGLGSCRSLLDSAEYLQDFKLKHLMPHSPLLANLGVAQLEQQLKQDANLDQVRRMTDFLQVDGLIIHINPLQEWFQLEGDYFSQTPLETIVKVIDKLDMPIIVKEVGQGWGPKSMLALMKLPLTAIEFGAWGGTNFSKLELLRSQKSFNPLQNVGHNGQEMVKMVNDVLRCHPQDNLVKNFIISGGIKTFLDGFYLCEKLAGCAIYGQAKVILDHADKYDTLASFIDEQLYGYACAQAFLEVKE